MNLTIEAEAFFADYHRIFDSGDMQAFSALFAEPFISVRADGGIASMPTNIEACAFFEQVLAAWQAEGYDHFATRDYAITSIGSNSMLVTLTWEMLDANQQLIREWRQSYNLLKTQDEWKVITSTFHKH